MQMNTRPADVLAVYRWLTTDDLEPSGRELLLAMKAEPDSPYVFFATRKAEEGKPPRLFVSWVHEAVLADMARLRLGVNARDSEVSSSSELRSRLLTFFEEVTGSEESFDDSFKQATSLIEAMNERGLLG